MLIDVGDVANSTKDVESGSLKAPTRRPLRLRSLIVRVLGVIAAAVACLVEGKSGFVPPLGLSNNVAGRATTKLTAYRELQSPVAFHSYNLKRASRLQLQLPFHQPQYSVDVASTPAVQTPRLGAFAIFWEACVKSSLWMSASLAGLIPFVQISSGVLVDWRPFWAGFFESMIAYTLDHLRDTRRTSDFTMRLKASSMGRMRALKTLSLVGLIGFASSVVLAPVGRHLTVGLTFTLHLMLCVAYAKLKPRMPYMKALYVSFCVVFMAVAAPAAYDPNLLTGFSPAALLRLIMLILSVSFTIENIQDLRDIREDKEAGVITLPSGLGIEWTRRLLLTSQFASVALQCCFAAAGLLPLRFDMLVVHCLCMLCALGFKETTPRSLFQLILEPMYVSPLAMVAVRSVLMHS